MQFETAEAFGKMVGLPKNLIYQLAKEGKISHIKTGNNHMRINAELAIAELDELSKETAKRKAQARPREFITQPAPKGSVRQQLKEMYKTRGAVL